MAEEKKNLTEAQKMILNKIIAKRDNSTFVLCVNEEQEAVLDEYRKLVKQIEGRQLNEDQQKALDEMKNNVLGIYNSNVYCAHCHNLGKLTSDIDKLDFKCECKEAQDEINSKKSIEAQQAALDKEFYDIQVAATNKAISLYKEKYKDVIEFRKKAFEKLDSDIMNAEAI